MQKLTTKIIKVNEVNLYTILLSFIAWQLSINYHFHNEYLGIIFAIQLFGVIGFFFYAAMFIPKNFKMNDTKITIFDWLLINLFLSCIWIIGLAVVANFLEWISKI